MRGQLEGERGAIPRDQLAGLAERERHRRLTLPHRARDAELEDEQLVEREPRAAGLGFLERTRLVQRDERVAALRQALALAQRGRQRIGNVAGVRERMFDKRP